jgi:hypothetical protein
MRGLGRNDDALPEIATKAVLVNAVVGKIHSPWKNSAVEGGTVTAPHQGSDPIAINVTRLPNTLSQQTPEGCTANDQGTRAW